jgi:hypothetical protein
MNGSKDADNDGEEFCNPEEFEAVNVLQDIQEKLLVSPSTRKPNSERSDQFQKTAIAVCKIGPMLKCIVNVNPTSATSSYIALVFEVAGECGLTIDDLQVDIPNSLVYPMVTAFPVYLSQQDRFSFLHNVTLFQASGQESPNVIKVASLSDLDNQGIMRRSLSLTVKYTPAMVGVSQLSSNFCVRLGESIFEGLLARSNIIANHGRLFESSLTSGNVQEFNGLQISLNGTLVLTSNSTRSTSQSILCSDACY